MISIERACAAATVVSVLMLCNASAIAQRSTAARTNRATRSSASVRVGYTGGLNTRATENAVSIRARTPVSPTAFDQRNTVMGTNALRTLPTMSQSFTPIARRLPRIPKSKRVLTTPYDLSGQRLAMYTGFERANRMDTPIGGWGVPGLHQKVRAPVFDGSAPQATTAIHRTFGLIPEPRQQARPPLQEPGYIRIEDQTDRRVAEMLKRGEQLFKQATDDEGEDDAENMALAVGQFVAVRDLDPDSYIPSILTFHAALEQGRTMLALHALAEAARRHPNVFIEAPDIQSYFGSPAVYQRQLRDNIRIAGSNEPTYELFAIQAYCAWATGDPVRLEQALRRIDEVQVSGELTETELRDLTAFKYAMLATLQ